MMRRFLRPATLLPSLSLLTVLMIGLLSPGAAPPARGSRTQIVRIGILLSQDVVSIGADGSIEAGDPAAQAVATLAPGTYEFRPAAQGIEAGGNRFGPVVRLRSANRWLQAGPPPYPPDAGGAPESSECVWGQPYPFLRGVPDPYGQEAPAREWLSRIDIPTLEARLVRAGKPVPGVAGG